MKKPLFIAYLVFCLLIIPELFFRFIVPAAQEPLGHFDVQEGTYKYFPRQSGVYTYGRFSQYRTRWRINNQGWRSPYDYSGSKTGKRIAVIGDSFIEALGAGMGKSYPDLLSAKLAGRSDVYAFGSRGAPMSEYLHISRYAGRNFDPDIIIFNVIYNDFIDSLTKYNKYYAKVFLTLSASSGKVEENAPSPDKSFAEFSFWKRFLRQHSALARYLIFNLKWRMFYRQLSARDFVWHKSMEFEVTPGQREEAAAAAGYIVSRVKAENPQRKIVFVMDGARECIYGKKSACGRSEWAHELLRGLCRENGVYFLDLTGPFESDFRAHQRMFNCTSDAHWNEYGHKIAAEAIYDFLRENSIIE